MRYYIVYDVLAKFPMTVFMSPNDESAKRSFVDLLIAPFTVVSDHPHQFELRAFDVDDSDTIEIMRGLDIDSDVLLSKKRARMEALAEAEALRRIKTMKDALNAINEGVVSEAMSLPSDSCVPGLILRDKEVSSDEKSCS